jgi:hypothetical protein
MTKKDKRPSPIVALGRGGLSPVTAWDAELLADMPQGAEFDLVARSKRSAAHNGKYWVQLGHIVKATEAFPTPEKMHQWVKMRLGYVETIYGPKGEPLAVIPDSTAFAQMDQAEFNGFYERAVRLIAEEMGIDVERMNR